MKKILGLDLGAASIGWALVVEEDNESNIVSLGSRVIPYNGQEGDEFKNGTGESRNSQRTTARTARKGYDRYQLRRRYLVEALSKNGIYPTAEVKAMQKDDLWQLRSVAPCKQISLPELGRLLLWLNQKRGYKSSRSDANLGKKDTNYVAEVKSRHQKIKEANQTIGQYFYQQMTANQYVRIKEQIFPREAYVEEFDAIIGCQKDFYPQVLTAELIKKIRNEIIYYQRALKSQKGLVSICEFEAKQYNGHLSGPKVAPKSSPLFQLAKIWENINNITIYDKEIDFDQKKLLFEYLDTHDKISSAGLLEILKLPKDTPLNKQLKNGLTGNKTYHQIAQCFGDKRADYADVLTFKPEIIEGDSRVYSYDKTSGEVLGEKRQRYISDRVEKDPYYCLWHTIYSIKDKDECLKALVKSHKIEESIAEKLAFIDFSTGGYGNKSAKVLRKVLPYLMDGEKYNLAMEYAGYNHSFSQTKDENLSRELLTKLLPLAKNSLRQPVVEKILNQMINLVNSIIERWGAPDEIRIELARELKQCKDERNDTDSAMRNRERENNRIRELLTGSGYKCTRRNVIKWRLYHEVNGLDSKLNSRCIYCGNQIGVNAAFSGDSTDVDHIIPQSKLYDDSQSNKVLVHRHCNANKGARTAYDFMSDKTTEDLDAYVDLVNELHKKKIIGHTKWRKLLMKDADIPRDFIDRQLRESQYIARKSREILQSVCRDVWCTTGSVTALLRRLWGWEDVAMNLQLPKYKELGMTEMVTWESDHGRRTHTKEVIKDWTKRDDHRHHAIDALTIACTKQGYVQRLNTLSAKSTRDEMNEYVKNCGKVFNEKLSLYEKYLIDHCPLSVSQVEDAVSQIFISFKSGKKSAVFGTRKIGRTGDKRVVQSGIVVPRGALSEETVYGKIRLPDQNRPIKYLFENPALIFKPNIKQLIEERLAIFEGDVKKALASTKKDPIYLGDDKSVVLERGTCYRDEYVVKYAVNTDFNKVDKVVDKAIKEILQRRLAKFDGKAKEAFRDVKVSETETVAWYTDEHLPRPILTVRCETGLSAVVPARKNEQGADIGFVKPGNNHHLAIYRDSKGTLQEHIVTFWHAVERKKFGLPVVITDPLLAYDKVSEIQGLSEDFLSNLPDPSFEFETSLQQNEMFVLGMEPEAFSEAYRNKDYALLSKHLYRVQKLSSGMYYFRHHLETRTDDKYGGDKNEMLSKQSKRLIVVSSFSAWSSYNPQKVKISLLGELTKV